jgi:TolB protein
LKTRFFAGLLSLGLVAAASAGPLSERIFFVASPGGIPKIYSIRPDGRDYRRLTHQLGREHEPAVSPSGRAVAFRSNREGADDIYRCNLEGKDVVRLTYHQERDRQPSWSPDGKQIVFATGRYGEEELAIMDAAEGERKEIRRLTHRNAQCSSPAWSPKGDWIAYSGYYQGQADIYLISPDGKSHRRITTDRQPDVTPSWSPDGERLVFQTQRGPRDIQCLGIYDLRTDKVEILSRIREITFYPTWSPDGHSLLFLGGGTRLKPKPKQYQVFDLSTSEVRVLPPPATATNNTFAEAGESDWSTYPFPWESKAAPEPDSE